MTLLTTSALGHRDFDANLLKCGPKEPKLTPKALLAAEPLQRLDDVSSARRCWTSVARFGFALPLCRGVPNKDANML